MKVMWASVALIMSLAVGLPAKALAAERPDSVFGAATGDADEVGSLVPLGNGRFAIQDRVYVGRSVSQSISRERASCLTGPLTSLEDWALEAPRMAGTHRSTLTVRSEGGSMTLRLVGYMEFPTASGGWEVTRAAGACAELAGEGRYTATFSTTSPQFRLTFEGQVRN